MLKGIEHIMIQLWMAWSNAQQPNVSFATPWDWPQRSKLLNTMDYFFTWPGPPLNCVNSLKILNFRLHHKVIIKFDQVTLQLPFWRFVNFQIFLQREYCSIPGRYVSEFHMEMLSGRNDVDATNIVILEGKSKIKFLCCVTEKLSCCCIYMAVFLLV